MRQYPRDTFKKTGHPSINCNSPYGFILSGLNFGGPSFGEKFSSPSEKGCEDTYNDNLWGTNCNNFVDYSSWLMDKIALITVLPEQRSKELAIFTICLHSQSGKF